MQFDFLFTTLAWWQIAFLGAAYVFAFFVKGFFGYGAVPPMVLAGTMLMPAHHAVLIAGLINAMTQIVLVPDGIRHGDKPLAMRMALLLVPGLVIGVLLFAQFSSGLLQVLVGLVILSLVLLETPKFRQFVEPVIVAHPRAFSAGAASATGLLAGVVGAGGMFFMSGYLRFLIAEKLSFRGTIILLVTAVLAIRTTLLGLTGLLTWTLALEALLFVPTGIAGSFLGTWMSRRVSNEAYFRAYQIFLVAASLLLIFRGITG